MGLKIGVVHSTILFFIACSRSIFETFYFHLVFNYNFVVSILIFYCILFCVGDGAAGKEEGRTK